MTDPRVLISTHDLTRAGELRSGFTEAGYRVELVTADETLSKSSGAALLVLTDGSEGVTGRLADQARTRLGIPVFAIVGARRADTGRASDSEPTASRDSWADEVFASDAPNEHIVLLGGLRVETQRLQKDTGIVGDTDTIREALERVIQIGPVDATVLVTGESGTGKELFARGLHQLSPRRKQSFIPVNVAALPESLLESELFGHEKGAFTGAVDRRKGIFELANHGTVFLDEIGEMSLGTQTNLLRVLEQREFHRVGGERMVEVDVRIVAATNQDLPQAVERGDFRRDLYYRLNVLSIRLPPLRDRRDDIPLLVDAFVEEAGERHDLPRPDISAEAMEILKAHSWPGNVRELRNLVESMVILAPKAPRRSILPSDLPYEVRTGGSYGGGLALVPVSLRSGRESASGTDAAGLRGELDQVCRGLVALQLEVNELRRDFEFYRQSRTEGPEAEAPVVGRISGSGSSGEIMVEAWEDEVAGDDGAPDPAPRVPVEGEHGHGEIPSSGTGVSTGDGDPSQTEVKPNPTAPVVHAGMTMAEIEREAIRATLVAVDGNRREAAKALGIGERTLYRKITKYELG